MRVSLSCNLAAFFSICDRHHLRRQRAACITGLYPENIPNDRQRSETMMNRIRMATMILLAASIAGPAFAETAGADFYKAQKCAMCHGADRSEERRVGKECRSRW